MRLDDLTIALRPRSGWEACDLGFALVRAHARRIWAAWFAVTLPVFAVLNALCWWGDVLWLAALLMWWLKPVFDRIPFYVLSRAVFGAQPTWRETVRAQLSWGWRGTWAWMHWRRFLHPGRALLMPVDLLEGLRGPRRAQRTRVLSRAQGSIAAMLTLIGMHLEAVLVFSLVTVGLMFVPVDFLADSTKAVFETLFENPPSWAQALMNLIVWLATSAIEPFYVGAGFGLYLNRRTQLEAWDIELSFRRMAQRLAQPLALLLVLGLAALAGAPDAHAADDTDRVGGAAAAGAKPVKGGKTPSLRTMLGRAYDTKGADFEAAVRKAYEHQDLKRFEMREGWYPREQVEGERRAPPTWADAFATVVSVLSKSGLWIVAFLLLIVILRLRHVWMPWFTGLVAATERPDLPAVLESSGPERLPDDIAAAARALWAEGQQRAALALLYRGAVRRLTLVLGQPLPPGATEADCLRRARGLSDTAAASAFTRVVRSWQAAAYAHRLPRDDEFEALLQAWNAPPVLPT